LPEERKLLANALAEEVTDVLFKQQEEFLRFYASLEPKFAASISRERDMAVYVMERIVEQRILYLPEHPKTRELAGRLKELSPNSRVLESLGKVEF
jgi:hypothetical protein